MVRIVLRQSLASKNSYEKMHEDKTVLEAWKRKGTNVRDAAWVEVFAPCDL
jgi:hypothetical protein